VHLLATFDVKGHVISVRVAPPRDAAMQYLDYGRICR
jgi:hypothetical protein